MKIKMFFLTTAFYYTKHIRQRASGHSSKRFS